MPEDVSNLRVVTHVKCNVGPLAAPQVYRVESHIIDANGQTIETSRLAYVGVSDLDAATLLEPPKPKRKGARQEAERWLRDHLADGVTHPSAEVKASADAAGISTATLKRAASDLVEVDEQVTDDGRVTTWKLRKFGRQGGQLNGGQLNGSAPLEPTAQTPMNTDDSAPAAGGSAQTRELSRPPAHNPFMTAL